MTTDSQVKSKFKKKLLAIPVVIIVVVAIVFSWQVYLSSSSENNSKVVLPALSLTLVGVDGQQKTLNAGDLAALKSYTSTGGFINDARKISVGNYTGVPMLTLLNLVGGVTDVENVTVTGSDGYKETFTYQQVQCQGMMTFDPITGASAVASQPMTMIVAYYCNGTALASGTGPLTVAIVGPQGLVTPGAYWAYLLVKIEVIPA